MRKLGWGYILGYCFDALLGVVASLVPSMEAVSNVFSALMIFFAVLVLVFICMSSLRPRKVFAVMLIFYGLTFLFGLFLGVLVLVTHGLGIQGQKMDIAFFRDSFGWYWPVHWILLTVWLAICAYAVVAYSRFKAPEPPPYS